MIANSSTIITKLPEDIAIVEHNKYCLVQQAATHTLRIAKHSIDLHTNRIYPPNPSLSKTHQINHLRVTFSLEGELTILDTRSPTETTLFRIRAAPLQMFLYRNLFCFSSAQGFGQIKLTTLDISCAPAKELFKSNLTFGTYVLTQIDNSPFLLHRAEGLVYSFETKQTLRLPANHNVICVWEHYLLTTIPKASQLHVYDLTIGETIRSMNIPEDVSVTRDQSRSSVARVILASHEHLVQYERGSALKEVKILKFT